MKLRKILLKYFLPFVLLFLTLSVFSLLPSVQKVYYPFFEQFTISMLNGNMEDVYFQAKPKSAKTDLDYNTVGVLFNSKSALTAIAMEARRRNIQAEYKYKGFNVTIDETFIAPLIFFVSLLLFTPGGIAKKLIAFLVGTLLILGFSYCIVYFKGLYMVNKSGVRDFLYSQNDLNFFQLAHFTFSSVTAVTVVLVVWILVAFRKSDLNKLFL